MRKAVILLLVLVGSFILLSLYSFDVYTEIVIDASQEQVWQDVIAMEDYHIWNEQLTLVSGEVAPGAQITLNLSAEGGEPYIFSPTIDLWKENEAFGWTAITGVPGIFDGKHEFLIKDTNGGVLLINKEKYSGVLALIMQQLPMMADSESGFIKMNQDLKQYIEEKNTF